MATTTTRLATLDDAPLPHPYGVDLAQLHHAHFGMVAEAAADLLLPRLKAAGFNSGAVVELAVGSGISSRRLLDAGFSVVGVDISEAMLAIARENTPGAQLHLGSLWDFDIPPCVAVTAIGEAINYVSAACRPDLDRLEQRLSSAAAALSPGGLLLLDFAGPGRSGPAGQRLGAWDYPEASLVLRERELPDGRALSREISAFSRLGSLYRRADESHELTLFTPAEVDAALAQAGLGVEQLEGYSDAVSFPGWNVIVATRPR